MADSYGHRPFGLNDVKITNLAGDTQVDLPVARQLSFSERIRSGELTGDDKVLSAVAFAEAVEWSLEEGGIDLAAYALMTGRTASSSGSTPNRTNTLSGAGAECFPWIKIYGKAISDDCDSDVHVKLWKCKVLSVEGRLQEGEFWVTSMSGISIDDGTNGVWDIVENETAASLPSS